MNRIIKIGSAIFALVLSIHSHAASVTIDGGVLSAPSNSLVTYVLNGDGKRIFLKGSSVQDLNDGMYTIELGSGQPFGTFALQNGLIASTSGALVGQPNRINFDLSLLTQVSFMFEDLSVPASRVNYAVTGVNSGGMLGNTTIYLPNGSYSVTTNPNYDGGSYGGFFTSNGTVSSIDGALVSQDANTLAVDPAKTLNVTLSSASLISGDGAFVYSFLSGVASWLKDGDSLQLPAGTYVNANNYGTFTIHPDLTTSTTGSLIFSAGGNLSFDISKLVKVDLRFDQLSEPSGPVGGAMPAFAVGNGLVSVYLARGSRHHSISINGHGAYIAPSAGYGSFEISADGLVANTSGYLLALNNEIGFDHCSLPALSVEPVAANSEFLLFTNEREYRNSATTYFLLDGMYTIRARNQVSAGAYQWEEVRFKISSQDGIQILSGGTPNSASISLNPSFCTPPDDDNDGIINDMDLCPSTPAGLQVDADGCSVQQSIALQCGAWKARSHGKFVSCTSHLLNDMVNSGFIALDEKGPHMSAAANDK